MKPEVSIVMPLKNCEKTILKSINSVLNQTFENFEIIIVDNNCIDSTINIIKEIKDPRIRIVSCQHDGIVPALNTGLSNCNSNLVARQDGDDIWYHEKLEKQVSFMRENKNIDICGTQIRIISKEYETIDDKFRYPINDLAIKSWLLTGKNSIAHPSVIFRKNILLRVGGYDDTYPIAEDHHMWLRCIKWCKFANLPEVLVDYMSNHNVLYDPRYPLMASEAQFKVLKHEGLIKV